MSLKEPDESKKSKTPNCKNGIERDASIRDFLAFLLEFLLEFLLKRLHLHRTQPINYQPRLIELTFRFDIFLDAVISKAL